MQTPTEFGLRFVTLRVVAPGSGCAHVLPEVATSTAAGHHVVDGLGRPPAVCAPTTVPREDGPAGQSDIWSVRNPHKSGQTYDQRDCEALPLAVQNAIAVGETNGLGGQDQDRGATHR